MMPSKTRVFGWVKVYIQPGPRPRNHAFFPSNLPYWRSNLTFYLRNLTFYFPTVLVGMNFCACLSARNSYGLGCFERRLRQSVMSWCRQVCANYGTLETRLIPHTLTRKVQAPPTCGHRLDPHRNSAILLGLRISQPSLRNSHPTALLRLGK